MARYKVVSGKIGGHSGDEPVEISDKDYETLKFDELLELELVEEPKPSSKSKAKATPDEMKEAE